MENLKQLWFLDKEKSLLALESSLEGLKEEEAQKRLLKFGKNTFNSKENKSSLSIFLKQFASPLIFLLIGASVITTLLQEWIDTGVILFAVLINVFLGFYQEYNAEKTLDKLTTYIKDRTKVIRDGREQEIDSSLVVPGDILKLSYGSRIPADSRILSINNLRVDEAILTGESLPIEKTDESLPLSTELVERKNIAHAGTLVVEGFAHALVYATGDDTEIGKIAGIVSGVERTSTPLQKSVNKLSWFIFFLVILIVIGIVFLGIYRGEAFLPMLVLASAVAVGAVPEALPIALTVILAIGSTRIANKKGIIRNLSAAETLGSTTLIMTDKTGTLTKADMELVGIVSSDSILKNENISKDKNFTLKDKKILQDSLHNVIVSIENPDAKETDWIFTGRPFEINIVKSAIHHKLNIDDLKDNSLNLILPFNSTNKFSVSEQKTHYTIMGAPDILLKKSNLDKEEYIKLEKWIERISEEGKRLIAVASVKKEKDSQKFSVDLIENITFEGMLIFFDPIRPEVPNAIKNIESHGMKIVLVTGDLAGTARSLARDLDWEVNDDQVLIGSDLRQMNDEDLLKLLPKIKIFARVTPEDKLRIGLLYQKLGEIVAMTGDGVNDTPALKAMDIGISLGSGSDVAKATADLVLLDDNFETISLAIDEGRKILGNVRKTFVYLMSNSLDQVFVIAGSLIFNLALPLTALQIIWVNLFTGSLPALSFAFDEYIDKDKSKARDLKLVFTKEVKILTLGIGVLSSLLLFLLYYGLLQTSLDIGSVKSIFFACFSSYVLVIAYSFRSLRKNIFSYDVFSNKKLNFSVLIAFSILIITLSVPFVRELFQLAPLPVAWIPFIVLWNIFNLALVETAKYAMYREKKIS